MIDETIEFKFFLEKFKLFKQCGNNKIFTSKNKYLNTVINTLGASSYNQGLLYLCNGVEVEVMTKSIEDAFPKTKNTITCFGRDWLNRRLAVRNEEPYDILRFDVVYNEVINIPTTLKEFFENEIIEYTDALLSEKYFNQWKIKNHDVILSCSECVDYKIAPSLGGKDDVSNLEVLDYNVAWHLNMQLRVD